MMNYVDIKRLFGRRFSTDMSAVIGVCRPSLLVYSWTVSRVILRTKLTSDGSIGVQTAERCDYYVLQSSLHSRHLVSTEFCESIPEHSSVS